MFSLSLDVARRRAMSLDVSFVPSFLSLSSVASTRSRRRVPRARALAEDESSPAVLIDADVAIALDAARAGARAIAAANARAHTKADGTIVTVADVACQVAMATRARERAPRRAFVGEETRASAVNVLDVARALEALNGEFADFTSHDVVKSLDASEEWREENEEREYWCADPLDGTRAFASGETSARWVIGLALVSAETGFVECAVMIAPTWDDGVGVEIVAKRGRGCFARRLDASEDAFERVRARDAEMDSLSVVISTSESFDELPLAIAGVVPENVTAMCCGSLCKYIACALGEADVFIQHPKAGDGFVNSWDHAAGILCCEEAGVIVSDCEGMALDVRGPDEERRRRFAPAGGGIVAASASVHDDVLRAYREGAALLARDRKQ